MLNQFTLKALAETDLDGKFGEAVKTVEQSLIRDADVDGSRKIIIEFELKPEGDTYIRTAIDVRVKVPNRKLKTIAAMNGEKLHIETTSNDARQPGFEFSGREGGKVVPMSGTSK